MLLYPSPKQQIDGLSLLNLNLEGPQTRTLNRNCEQTLSKWRTNRTMNQTGISDQQHLHGLPKLFVSQQMAEKVTKWTLQNCDPLVPQRTSSGK